MPESQQTGPITVGHPVAQAQLLDEGELVSFRTRNRTTGDTWWRESRTGPKRGDVRVEKVYAVSPRGRGAGMANYVNKSGFDSVNEWQEAIEELHGEIPETGFLYRVTTRDADGE